MAITTKLTLITKNGTKKVDFFIEGNKSYFKYFLSYELSGAFNGAEYKFKIAHFPEHYPNKHFKSKYVAYGSVPNGSFYIQVDQECIGLLKMVEEEKKYSDEISEYCQEQEYKDQLHNL